MGRKKIKAELLILDEKIRFRKKSLGNDLVEKIIKELDN